MKTPSDCVRDFMIAYDQTVRTRPVDSLPEWEKMLRVQLLLEEVYELAEALNIEVTGKPTLTCKSRDVDPVAVADALTDLTYVLLGAYHTTGQACLALDAFNEVHSSNMSKLGPDGRPLKNADGKVMKGPEYRPPSLGPIVQHYIDRPSDLFTS